MSIKVFKFGGASLKDAAGVRNVGRIMNCYASEKILVVVSAMGKTTNALENVVRSYFANDGKALSILEQIKITHYQEMQHLFDASDEVFAQINDAFVEIEWILEDEPHDSFNYIYDQVVGMGEVFSSKIVTAFIEKNNQNALWLDARDVVKTDENWRESAILWQETTAAMRSTLPKMFSEANVIVTQGFIGSTKDNNTTTLGREGSDYSAAIFSHGADAEAMYIWKDVDGVYNGDPRVFKNTKKLDFIGYGEAIEMTYYGATVVHPRTIAPLLDKKIPLFVRSFLKPDALGTKIAADTGGGAYPPIFMVENNQMWIRIKNKDNTFLLEDHVAALYATFAKYSIFVNLIQPTGAAYFVSITNAPEKVTPMLTELATKFDLETESNLDLLNVRHYTTSAITELKEDKTVVFEVKTPSIYQILVKK